MSGKSKGKAAVLHNAVGDDARHDQLDVIKSAETVSEALCLLGYEPVAVPVTLDLEAAKTALLSLAPAFVFNLVEELDGRGSLIHLAPALLDALGIPYTGSSTEALSLTSGKLPAKRLLRLGGVPTPDWHEKKGLLHGEGVDPDTYIVKSAWEHASVGMDGSAIIPAKEPEDLLPEILRREREMGGEWFAERFVQGREFNLSLLAGHGPEPEVLPPAEIRFDAFPPDMHRIVDFAAKWEEGSFAFSNTPRSFEFPDSDAPLLARLSRLCKDCWELFSLKGYARVDFRVDEGGSPWALEINANPCISPDAGFAAAAAQAGLGMREVVERIVNDCLRHLS
jgi:D-alanine-D-alanine ligase